MRRSVSRSGASPLTWWWVESGGSSRLGLARCLLTGLPQMASPNKPLVLFVTAEPRDFALASKRLAARWRVMWMAPAHGPREWDAAQRLRPVAVVVSVGSDLASELPQLHSAFSRARPAPVVALGLKAQRRALLAAGASDVLARPVSYERLDEWLKLARAVGARTLSTPPPSETLVPHPPPASPKPTP